MPSQAHEDRVDLLRALANLCGCTQTRRRLPDGSEPDVLHEGPYLFVGDAKATESPGTSASRARLARYFSWVAIEASMARAGTLLALCFGTESHERGWSEILVQLAAEHWLKVTAKGTERFPGGHYLAWVFVISGDRSWLTGQRRRRGQSEQLMRVALQRTRPWAITFE